MEDDAFGRKLSLSRLVLGGEAGLSKSWTNLWASACPTPRACDRRRGVADDHEARSQIHLKARGAHA
jgi:hypothetical protein